MEPVPPFFPFIPLMIPFAGMLVAVVIVGIVFWYKAREKELQFHQDLRLREMDHQRRMKEIELEIEKVKAAQSGNRTP